MFVIQRGQYPVFPNRLYCRLTGYIEPFLTELRWQSVQNEYLNVLGTVGLTF